MSDPGEIPEEHLPIFPTPLGPAQLMNESDRTKFQNRQRHQVLKMEMRSHAVFDMIKNANDETLDAINNMLVSIVHNPDPGWTYTLVGLVQGTLMARDYCPAHLVKHGDNLEEELEAILRADEDGDGSA